MTLRDMIDSGIQIEGYVEIRCWENDTYPDVYYEGYDVDIDRSADYMDKEIAYIFAYEDKRDENGVRICIELRKEE
jgi:uncharacterized protein YcnI